MAASAPSDTIRSIALSARLAATDRAPVDPRTQSFRATRISATVTDATPAEMLRRADKAHDAPLRLTGASLDRPPPRQNRSVADFLRLHAPERRFLDPAPVSLGVDAAPLRH